MRDLAGRGPAWPIERVAFGEQRFTVRCTKCEQGYDDLALKRNTRNTDDDTEIVKIFARKGWTKLHFGKGVCPDCNKPKPKPKEEELNAPAKPPVERSPKAIKALPELYMMLGDYYDPIKKAYKPGWSDEKIADDLELSVQFVRDRRESDFGKLEAPADPLAQVRLSFAEVERLQIPANIPLNELPQRLVAMSAAIQSLRTRLDLVGKPEA